MAIQSEREKTPLLLWPFVALWRLLTSFLVLIGRLLLIATGLFVGMIGVVLCFTVVGAIVGIPLLLLGFFLMARGFF